MAKKIKNISNSSMTIGGVFLNPNESYTFNDSQESAYCANQDNLIVYLTENKVEVYNDSFLISGISNAINFLKGEMIDPSGYPISLQLPFASKTLNGKKLFKRIHGMNQDCIVGENLFEFIVPYNQCKITGIEMINSEPCDYVNLEVYDSDQGLVSGTPNLKLNQFGFNVSISKDYYEHKSEYDADLYIGMKVTVRYHSQTIRKIGINIILNEVK